MILTIGGIHWPSCDSSCKFPWHDLTELGDSLGIIVRVGGFPWHSYDSGGGFCLHDCDRVGGFPWHNCDRDWDPLGIVVTDWVTLVMVVMGMSIPIT